MRYDGVVHAEDFETGLPFSCEIWDAVFLGVRVEMGFGSGGWMGAGWSDVEDLERLEIGG